MIERLNHVGLSVTNLERSLGFYRDLLGLEVAALRNFEGEKFETILGLDGVRGRVALLKGPNIRVELFEFAHPSPKVADPHRPVCDRGITHFCIEVSDVSTMYDRLRAAGVPFHSAPVDFSGEATAVYGRDPDGNVFELWARGAAASQLRSAIR
jgi:catechol 2,3-dioxygenase-like lactoylglutathione lyase family enzyme